MIIVISVLTIIALILVGAKMNTSDPYGTFHLALNVRPEDESKGQKVPKTEWLNMGYWKVSLS